VEHNDKLQTEVVGKKITRKVIVVHRSRARHNTLATSSNIKEYLQRALITTPAVMAVSRNLLWQGSRTGASLLRFSAKRQANPVFSRCPTCRNISQTARRRSKQAADNPDFMSIVDNPPQIVRTGRRHGPGLIVLGTLPITPRTLLPNLWNSYNTNHCLCARNMASPTPRMEIQTPSQARRPSSSRSPPSTAQD